MSLSDESRISKAQQLYERYPSHIPIIMNYNDDTFKFLIHRDMCVATLMTHAKKKCNIKDKSTDALFILIGRDSTAVLPRLSSSIYDLYNEHGYKGMLDVTLKKENTFG